MYRNIKIVRGLTLAASICSISGIVLGVIYYPFLYLMPLSFVMFITAVVIAARSNKVPQ